MFRRPTRRAPAGAPLVISAGPLSVIAYGPRDCFYAPRRLSDTTPQSTRRQLGGVPGESKPVTAPLIFASRDARNRPADALRNDRPVTTALLPLISARVSPPTLSGTIADSELRRAPLASSCPQQHSEVNLASPRLF